MVHSPIKFDDLAFILLFFFMIIAVISFSNSMNIDAEKPTEEKTESIAVFLDSNGTLSQSTFNNGDIVDLSVSPDADWAIVQNAVKVISSQNAVVTLVIE